MSLFFSPVQVFPFEPDLVLIPFISGWQLKLLGNSGTPVYDFMKNSPQSGKFSYQLKPKSAYNTYINQGYTGLKVRGSIELPLGDSSWLSVGSDWFPVANYTATNSLQFKDIDFMISPSLTISQGVHNAKVKFHIEGVKNGITEILSTYEIPVVLNVFEEGYFYSPDKLSFYYTQSTVPSQNLKVGGNNWQVNVPEGLTLSGNNAVQNPDGSFTASGTGLKDFSIGLSNNIGLILDDQESIVLPVTVTYPTAAYTVPVTVFQAGNYYPDKITFSIQNGQVDELFKIVNLTRSDAYTVNSPANIGYEQLDTVNGKKLKLYIIDSDAFGSGVFNLNLQIVYSDAVYDVSVIVSVGNQFDLGLDFSAVFTHSMSDLEFSTSNTNSYIDLVLSIVGSSENYNYQFPFFKGKAKKNIGKALSNFINYDNYNRFSLDPGTTVVFPVAIPGVSSFERTYSLNYFNLNVKERKEDTDLLTFGKSNVPFLLGYKPVVIDNKAILQHNVFSRFNSKSFALVNVFSQTGVFDYKIMKNGEQVLSAVQQFGYIKTIKVDFNLYDAVAGDVFDFILLTGTEEIKKSFVIYPEGNQSIDIVYLDSFGLPGCINFTGATKNINSEFDFKLENFLNKNFLNTRKYIEKELSELTLNTGYLLKSQSLEIAELMKSGKAWVVVNDEKILELVPKTNKIEESSADNYLYSYSVEFYINKETYAQDYNI